MERLSVEELNLAFKEIENLDLEKLEIDEIKDRLTPIFKGFKTNSPSFFPGMELYRGIKYSSKPIHIDYLTCPPKEYAKLNRASRDRQPMFYAATSRDVPFFELKCEVNDTLVISRWRTIQNLLVNNVGFTEENFTSLNSNRKSEDWNHIFPKVMEEPDRLIQNFLAKNFSQNINDDSNLYKLTTAIAEKLYPNTFFNGLLYPTIAMRANADNIVIKPEFLEGRGLVFIEVEFIKIKAKRDFQYDIDILDWANSVNDQGEIEWKGRLPEWKMNYEGEYSFAYEGSKLVARDKNGDIVEPT